MSELPQVLELTVKDGVRPKEIITALEEQGFEARLMGQGHDTMREVEVLSYNVKAGDSGRERHDECPDCGEIAHSGWVLGHHYCPTCNHTFSDDGEVLCDGRYIDSGADQ